MERWICTACGTQFSERERPPAVCPICADDRQPPNVNFEQWTTLGHLSTVGSVRVEELEPGLTAIAAEPGFAIGQHPTLARTPAGNVLWDCMAYLDDDVERAVRDLGGLTAMAISHPHFHGSMVEWADRFDVPIHIHADHRAWVMRPSPRIRFWAGDTLELVPGATVVRLGGHFPGSAVLHWEHAADGRGVLLTSDTIYPLPASRRVTFMYSYPNMLPLPAVEVARIREAIAPYAFDRIYSSWFGRGIGPGARETVLASADSYLAALGGHVDLVPRSS